ncbi:MAG: Smr domain-containing [Desulfobulbaceae bacterium]|nr:MAG: Smr domain-containing [Desulfobulbaceae bacterium]
MVCEMVPCQVCGNNINQELKICPYCEEEQELASGAGVLPASSSEKCQDFQHPAAASQPSRDRAGLKPPGPAAGILHKVVNLETGRPFVEAALRKLTLELANGRRQNLRVLTIIHGYGSSGKGGAIKVECRKVLEYLKGKGEINTFIAGEDFRQRSGPTRDLLRRFPLLADNVHLNKGNPGITLVVL